MPGPATHAAYQRASRTSGRVRTRGAEGTGEPGCVSLRGDVFSFQRRVEVCLRLGWRDVPDGLEEEAVVEPVDPFQRRVFDGLETAPWAASMNELSLEQAVDCFGQRIVVAVTNVANSRFDAGFAQPLDVTNGQILRTAVAVMHQPHAFVGLRSWTACSSAFKTNPVWANVLARQPTILRA